MTKATATTVVGALVLLGIVANGCVKRELPLTEEQQEVAERLEKTERGDLVFDAKSGSVLLVVNRRKHIVVLENRNNRSSTLESIDEVARWADIVTNGLSEDPRYCQLAEIYLSEEM